MLEKNEIKNIIAVSVLILVVVAIYMLPSQTQQEAPESKEQDTLIKQPQINIREVKSVVTASKPEEIVMRFAAESQADKEGTELTIYNQNLALVKEYRSLPLKSGLNLVKY